MLITELNAKDVNNFKIATETNRMPHEVIEALLLKGSA
jgi:hypothetical protein